MYKPTYKDLCIDLLLWLMLHILVFIASGVLGCLVGILAVRVFGF